MTPAPRRTRGTDESVPQNPQTAPNLPHAQGSEMSGFIWAQLGDLQRAVGDIQGTQKHILSKLDDLQTANNERLKAIEADVGDVKKAFHAAKWVGYVVGLIVSVAFGFVVFLANEAWQLAKPSLIEKITTSPVSEAKPTQIKK